MPAVSNGRFLPVAQPVPYAGAGWQVKVLSYTEFERRKSTGGHGVALITIPSYIRLTISPTLCDEGAGSITLNLDAKWWDLPLSDGQPAIMLQRREHVWQVFEDGALRFEFLGQVRTRETVPAAGRQSVRTLTVSGPGIADVLRWGTVMTPHYPKAPPKNSTVPAVHRFTNTPMMAVWAKLLQACQRRGTLQFVTARFGATTDTAGQRWQDLRPPPPRTPPTGTDTVQSDALYGPDLNSYTLTPQGQVLLSGIAAKMHGDKPRISVVVHCDFTASHQYNQLLSERQAAACKAYLTFLLPKAIITTRGYGETRPIASNRTAAGRRRNRRTIITYPVKSSVPEHTYTPPLSANLLDLLKEFSGQNVDEPSPVRLEWFMHPGFILDVRRQFGRRREQHVIFHEGSTATLAKDNTDSTAEVANLIAVQTEAGDYSVSTHPTSVAMYRQREHFVRLEGRYDTTARRQIASAALHLRAYGIRTMNLRVAAYAPGRRVFRDYTLGDWIGVAYNSGQSRLYPTEAERVMAISITVSGDGRNVECELTLQSTREAARRKLQAAVTSLLSHRRNVRVFVTDHEPLSAVEGDLWTVRTPQ